MSQTSPSSAVSGAAGSSDGRCIHHLFEAQAARTPHAPAVRFHGRTVTYAELDARAGRIARALHERGVGPEVPVGVFLPRTPDLVAALLGVLKAGGGYVPLDPAYPPERVAFMLADSGARAVVTTSALAWRLADFHGPVLRIDADAGEIEAHSADPLDVGVDPKNLAYVIYTSGSTGRPKGVQIEHRSTVALLHWLRGSISDEERAAVLGSTSVCFDVSIAEIFGTLCWGGTLVLVENALALAGIADEVRTACMVPSAAGELLRVGGIPPSVRTLGLGGEPLRNELAQRLFAPGHVRRVLNLYGPTEDTTYSTCKDVERGRTAAMTVGLPVHGTTARVLDANLDEVERGATGELWLTGAGLARGYAGNAAMTADRWRPDPHADVPGARMYRTGDLGRWLADGDLECLGRVDQQVKIRGHRVEPGEVESVLESHPSIRHAAVTPWEDRGHTRLAAYVVSSDDEQPDAAELRRYLRGRLPDYMVPDAFTFLGALPYTPSGKVDRKTLPPPVLSRTGSAEHVAPASPEEEAVARIWAEVLGMEAPGVRDDFFEIGGHSLQATQIGARIRDEMGVEVPLATLFAASTIEELARAVAELRGAREAEAKIPRVRRGGPLPLTFPQEAVWFFQHLVPGMRSYNFQATVRVRGPLDVAVLERALTEIVRRHEIFRTTFPSVDGAPVQMVGEPWEASVPVVDLTSISDDSERETEFKRLLKEEFLKPFHLDRLPLVRWALFRMTEDEHVLACVEQHLVHDGWSFSVFLREMKALYEAFLRGEPSPLSEPEIQVGDYAAWQRAWMRTPEARGQVEAWKRRLEGAPPVLALPGSRPRPAAMSFRGGSHRVRLRPDLFAAADAFSRGHGATLFMTLFAAFQALLHRYTGETDLVVGSGMAGRRRREAEGLIGMLVNTLPVRTDASGDPSFAALVERVRGSLVDVYAHQDVPFAEIVNAVHPERSRGHQPIFQVAFNFHHAPYPEMRLGDARMEVAEGLGNESAKFDLNVVVIPRAHQHAGDEVVMIWEWAEDLLDAATARRMIGHFETLLGDALRRPDAPLSSFHLLPTPEEADVLRLGAPDSDPPTDFTVHELFERRAREAPDAVAIVDGERSMTYAELDAAANRLARRLRAAGLPPEGRVGVAMERSAGLIVAWLAALKAGGAYVPMDAAYPAERLAFMAQDAGVSVLVVADCVPESLSAFAGPVVSLERDRAEIESLSADPLDDVAVFPDSLAYVVYTSGSTGTPKGVAIPHRGVARMAYAGDYAPLAADDRVAHLASVSFDAAAWEVWAPLLAGARVVVIGRDDALSPPALAARIRDEGVTALFLTTALFHQVAEEAPHAFTGLRHLLTGGETLDPSAARRALEAGAPRRLLNMYGPAESTTYATWHAVGRVEPDAPSVPIGRAVAATRLYVLDAHLRPVPVGVAGELFIGGAGLARGYLGKPELTAERFVADPFSGHPGARLYRTGDRVRWREGGALEFLGRVDQQVKVRGFRVEPGEIETALRAHPAVADAAVALREDRPGDRYLAAYVVGAEGAEPDTAALRAWLAARLPAYMVPGAIVPLAALPQTPGGKLDRRALPAPHAAGGEDGYVPPATETEEAVAAIWREVLGAERVGARDNFFDLGGHSLRATRIVSRVEAALGVRIPVSTVFDRPTVADMARLVDVRRAAADPDRLLDWLETLSEEEAERLLAEIRE